MYKTLELNFKSYKTISNKSNVSYCLYLENEQHIQLYYLNLLTEQDIQLIFINFMDELLNNGYSENHNYCNPFTKNEDKLKNFIEHNSIFHQNLNLNFEFFIKNIPPKTILLEICYDFTDDNRNYLISYENFYDDYTYQTNEIIHNTDFFMYLGFVLCFKKEIYIEHVLLRFKKGGFLEFDLFDMYPKKINDSIEYILCIYKNIDELLHVIIFNDMYESKQYIREIKQDYSVSQINKINLLSNDCIQSIIIDGKEKDNTNDISIMTIGLCKQ